MTRSKREKTSCQRRPEEREVSDEVEELMPRGLVFEAWLREGPCGIKDQRTVPRRALDQPPTPERLKLLDKPKGSRRRDLLDEGAVIPNAPGRLLTPNCRMGKIDARDDVANP